MKLKKHSFPLYKLSWLADVKIRRQIKQAFAKEKQSANASFPASFLALWLRPQYALALSSLCVAFLFGGYFAGQKTASETPSPIPPMATPAHLAVQTRMLINPYQALIDNSHSITTLTATLTTSDDPISVLEQLNLQLESQAQALETQVIRSEPLKQALKVHLAAHQALYQNLAAQSAETITENVPPSLKIIEGQLIQESVIDTNNFSIEDWLTQ